MADSILNDTKKILGIDPSMTNFDTDVVIHINSVFSILTQLGIGPADGFMIQDDTATWDAFIGSDPRLNLVKSYVYLRVRLMFDPPTTSYLVESMKTQVHEYEWRLNVQREGESWTDPTASTESSTITA